MSEAGGKSRAPPGGPGQHASRRAADPDAKRGADFWERIQSKRNTTKIGNGTNPRDVASQIAAQARAAVDCPVLQCVGPQSINQGMKAVAIARTYLEESDRGGATSHPDLVVYPEFVKVNDAEGEELSSVQLVIAKRARRPGVGPGREMRALKVAADSEAKSVAGAIASCTREGSRAQLTAIGAGSVNQAVKAVAIARQYVEDEAIDLCCRPDFVDVEIADGGDGAGVTSAMRLVLLVEQT